MSSHPVPVKVVIPHLCRSQGPKILKRGVRIYACRSGAAVTILWVANRTRDPVFSAAIGESRGERKCPRLCELQDVQQVRVIKGIPLWCICGIIGDGRDKYNTIRSMFMKKVDVDSLPTHNPLPCVVSSAAVKQIGIARLHSQQESQRNWTP